MTLEELKAYPKPYLTPAIVGKIMDQDPHAIRIQARTAPGALGFPISVCGTRIRIPKWSFIKFWFGEQGDVE